MVGISTLPETNSSHLKMDGWNTIVSYWDGLFSGAIAVSFREATSHLGSIPRDLGSLATFARKTVPQLLLGMQNAGPMGFLCPRDPGSPNVR